MPPSAVHRTVAATGVAAALALGDAVAMAGAAGAAGAVTPDAWAQLRTCESSGNYAVNTGNGYFGAYQFNLATWHGLGYPGLPSDASPAVQDQAAQALYAQRGWQPWPACSTKLGLVDDRQASRDDTRAPLAPPVSAAPTAPPASAAPTTPQSPAPSAAPVVAPAPVAAPAPKSPAPTAAPIGTAAGWDGHYITVRDVGSVRADVAAWQTQMVADGYPLGVDGRYGPKSAAAATQFEIDHHLAVERPGVVGPQIWSALFAQ